VTVTTNHRHGLTETRSGLALTAHSYVTDDRGTLPEVNPRLTLSWLDS